MKNPSFLSVFGRLATATAASAGVFLLTFGCVKVVSREIDKPGTVKTWISKATAFLRAKIRSMMEWVRPPSRGDRVDALGTFCTVMNGGQTDEIRMDVIPKLEAGGLSNLLKAHIRFFQLTNSRMAFDLFFRPRLINRAVRAALAVSLFKHGMGPKRHTPDTFDLMCYFVRQECDIDVELDRCNRVFGYPKSRRPSVFCVFLKNLFINDDPIFEGPYETFATEAFPSAREFFETAFNLDSKGNTTYNLHSDGAYRRFVTSLEESALFRTIRKHEHVLSTNLL